MQIINDQYVPSKSKWRKLENALIFINKSKVASKVKCQNTLGTGQKNHFRRWLKYDGTKNAQPILIIINH